MEQNRLIEKLHSENVERLVRIEAGNEHLDKCLDELKRRLFGNGQPGELSALKKRVTALEISYWKAVGTLTCIAAIVGFLTGGGTLTLHALLGK